MKEKPKPIRALPGVGSDVVLVCRKCSQKLGGGFGPDGEQRLSKVLTRELEARRKLGKKRGAAVTVIETKCLGLCPKRQVVAVRAGQNGYVLLVPPGSAPDAVAVALGFHPNHAKGCEETVAPADARRLVFREPSR